MSLMFDIPQPTVAIADRDYRWPVRRILCVGRNYAAHAREMGKDPDREPPFFFSKPADAVVDDGITLPYPPQTENLHYEGELVIAIGQPGTGITEADAPAHIWGFAVGNDLTRRDLQAQAKEMGRPWDLAKGFDHSAVIGPIHPVSATGPLSTGRITTTVNGAVKQDADLSDMIWSVPEIVSILSHSITLMPGDLIMTGTPAGVGPLSAGDHCTVAIDGLGNITSTIGPAI
ncbi:MAG: fumarylacetoacetate hydrolase family protein [Pseudomonadota bacterium]